VPAMRKPPEVDDQEFRRAVADVQPIAPTRRRALRRAPPPAPIPLQTRRDERAALAETLNGPVSLEDALESGEELVFLREGLSRQILRRLRRGHWVVQDDLDLHGMNRAQAAISVHMPAEAATDRQIRLARLACRGRRDRLVAALRQHAPQVRVTGIAAGLHALAELPPGADEEEVTARAAARGLAVDGLASYRAAAAGRGPALVVGYGRPAAHAYTAALARLCAVLAPPGR